MNAAKLVLVFLLTTIAAILIHSVLYLFGYAFIGCEFDDHSCAHDPIGGILGLLLYYFIFFVKYPIFIFGALSAKRYVNTDRAQNLLIILFFTAPLFFDLARYFLKP